MDTSTLPISAVFRGNKQVWTVRHAYLKIRDGHMMAQQHETHKMSRCILFGHDHQIRGLLPSCLARSHHGIKGGWLAACVCVRATCPACQTRPAVQGPLDRSERWRRSRPAFPEASRSPRSSGLSQAPSGTCTASHLGQLRRVSRGPEPILDRGPAPLPPSLRCSSRSSYCNC